MKKIRFFCFPSERRFKDIVSQILNYLTPIFMGIYIFINPLPLDSVSEMFFYLSCAALLILLLFRKAVFTLRSPLALGMSLFFIWAVMGLFTTLDFSNTLHDLRAYLLEYLIIFYLLINFYNSQERLEMISIIVIVSATLFSFGGIIVYYFIQGHALDERFGLTFKEMYTGWICFTTIFASILSLRGMYNKSGETTLCLAYFFCFLILSVVTLLDQSRSALIGLAIAMFMMSLYKKKVFILVLVVIALTFSVPNVKNRIGGDIQSITESPRSKMLHLSLEVIKDHPITGIGYGGQIYNNKKLVDLEKYNAKLPEKYQQKETILSGTHNMFIDVTVRTGLVGLVLFCMIILTAIWMLYDIFRRRREDFFRMWSISLFACFSAYLSLAFFLDALYGPQAVLMYVILAMINILWNLSQISRAKPSDVTT